MIQITDRQAEEILLAMRKSYSEMRRQKCPLADAQAEMSPRSLQPVGESDRNA